MEEEAEKRKGEVEQSIAVFEGANEEEVQEGAS